MKRIVLLILIGCFALSAAGCNKVCKHETWIESVEKEATCLEEGRMNYTCAECGLKRFEVIPISDHTPEVDPAVDPLPGVPGWTEGSHCAVCGQVLIVQEMIEALPIELGEYETPHLPMN